MITALTCPRCGAPLPLPSAPHVVCAYCGGSAAVAGVAPPTPPDPQRALAAIEAFRVAMSAGGTPYAALTQAARQHLGPFGETDALARVVTNLALDFDRQNGTKVAGDPLTMVRLMQGYLTAIEGIRALGTYVLSMPFFSANKDGPVNFHATLTAASIAALAARAVS